MSVPYATISCSDCDHEWTSLLTAGYFHWTDGRACASMQRHLAVCRECCSVSAAEVLPVWEELLDAERLWRMSSPQRRSLQELLGDGRCLTEFSRLALNEPDSFGLLYRISTLHRQPVCLRCGSEDFTKLRYPSDFIDDGTLFRLRLAHPGCGGDLMIHGSNGDRLAIALETREYDWRTGRQVSGPALEAASVI